MMCRMMRNLIPNIIIFVSFCLAALGGVEGLCSIFTGHSLFADTTPPVMHSSVSSEASCMYTILKPSVTVDEPDIGFWERREGLKLVKLYVGSEKVGEWPIANRDVEEFKLTGLNYELRVKAQRGPVIAVAEDYAGNVGAKEIPGAYNPPFCYNKSLSQKNSCKCAD